MGVFLVLSCIVFMGISLARPNGWYGLYLRVLGLVICLWWPIVCKGGILLVFWWVAMGIEGLVVGESWLIVGMEIVMIMIDVLWILRAVLIS
jgi:hypothetical protein